MKALSRILLILTIAVLAMGLLRFAQMRFQGGELYPAYSTFRSDPLGAKALHDSLRQLRGSEVSRNLGVLAALSPEARATVILLGLDPFFVTVNPERLVALAREGGRVVVALDARTSREMARETDRIRTVPTAKREMETNAVSLPAHLGLKVQLIDPLRHDTRQQEAEARAEDLDLPETLPWFGRYCFEPRTDDWETVYEVKDKIVAARRTIGLGSIVVIADSFPFSNEALLRDRSPEFLLWALGGGRPVVFDETHLGLEQGGSVAVLMREFRMHGFVAGCLLLAILWIWRNSSSLVPPSVESDADASGVQGWAAREGVTHLLRRNIGRGQFLDTALREWAATQSVSDPRYADKIREAKAAQASMPDGGQTLAESYNVISKILSPRRTRK